MTKRRNGWLGLTAAWFALLALLPPAPAWAARPEEDGPGPPPRMDDQDESTREELAETIEIYMMARMKRVLSLTDEQERRLVPPVEDLFSSRREANRKRRLATMKLRVMLEEEAGDREIAAVLDQLEEIDAALREKEMKVRAEAKAALSPPQQARFVLFQERFRQEMQERLRRLQEGESAPPPGGPRRVPPREPGRPGPRR